MSQFRPYTKEVCVLALDRARGRGSTPWKWARERAECGDSTPM